jgi:putative PIN family toxin of toxin-antitoxin system
LICVIDWSVWISGLQFGGSPLHALDSALDEHRIALCPAILYEVRTALSEKFQWSAARIRDLDSSYFANAIEVDVCGRLHGICRDPKDDMVLECAALANADAIVSGDKDLLALGEYEGIRILTPRAFIDEFAGTIPS